MGAAPVYTAGREWLGGAAPVYTLGRGGHGACNGNTQRTHEIAGLNEVVRGDEWRCSWRYAWRCEWRCGGEQVVCDCAAQLHMMS